MKSLLRTFHALFGSRLRMLDYFAEEISEIGRVHLAGRTVVFVNSPELVQQVLIERVDDFVKGPALRIISRPLLGDGLLTSEGEAHRQHRKLVAPAFAHQRVSKYAAAMERRTRRMAEGWRDGAKIDIAQAMMRLTLGIVGETLFDADLLDEADTLAADITTVQRHAMLQLRVPFRMPRFGFVERARERLDAKIYGMIRARRAAGRDHGDLLSMLLLSRDEETGEALSDKQVRDEAMTLFVAGHETTAQALSWCWYLLALHPECAAEVRHSGRDYALLVVKEAMRLYPPAYLIGRTAARSVSIGGFQIQEGELLLIAPWTLQRDPRFFPEPLRFDPERFRNEAAIPRFAYLPFGGGKRICIGNQFALMEAQIVLATLASEFQFELARGWRATPEPLLTLRPAAGIPVSVRRSNFLPVASVLRQGAEI